ncbi:MAG: glycosyltransferase family 2 protein [Salinarimonadaceae bacterium]|nr:MAG: glycosyltransferase family 2 protein [Salinarimonadaceae bacterium]
MPGPGETRLPVTCAIIARDEEDRIGRCIASVIDLVDDVVVVDSGSLDRTVAVAQEFGARVFHNQWPGYGPQKRFAEDQARNDWILSLDADEWLPPETQAEIASYFGGGRLSGRDGVYFRIPTVYPGKEKPRPFAGYHAHVRLYDRRRRRIPDSLVHDAIDYDPKTMFEARHPIHHQSIRSLAHLVEKNVAYFHLQAVEAPRSKLATLPRLLVEPLAVFLKYYVLRRHFTGGLFGLRYALTIAQLRTYRLAVLAGFFRERTEAARRTLGAGPVAEPSGDAP